MKLQDLEKLAQQEISRRRLIKTDNPSFTVCSPTEIVGELIPGISPKLLGRNQKGYVYSIDAKKFLLALERY